MSTVSVPPAVAEELLSLDPPALLSGRCRDCGALHFPRRQLCPECQGVAIDCHPLPGTGSLYTFTIVRMSPPGYIGETPYAIGVVELPAPAGLRVAATITADELDSLQIGDDVAFELITLGSGEERVTSYAFRQRVTP
jgi:uncharacterized OB-fold protein